MRASTNLFLLEERRGRRRRGGEREEREMEPGSRREGKRSAKRAGRNLQGSEWHVMELKRQEDDTRWGRGSKATCARTS